MKYLHAKISEIDDEQFQTLIDELYHCVDWRRNDRNFSTLFLLLGGIGAQDPKSLTPSHLPTGGVLTTKIDKLSRGVVADLCHELADFKHTHIESYDGKTVLSLLKTFFFKAPRPRKPGKNQLRHDATDRIIKRRRANGDL